VPRPCLQAAEGGHISSHAPYHVRSHTAGLGGQRLYELHCRGEKKKACTDMLFGAHSHHQKASEIVGSRITLAAG
jgi:hypothetical protein